MKDEIKNCIEVLNKGGLILYPTDTIWGIGCDATNGSAVEKIFKLKKRSKEKSMIILLDDENKLLSYIREVPQAAHDLIEFTEKPLTIIYDGAKNIAGNLIAQDGSIGIRITRDEFCKELIKRFRKPIVSTSANISGEAVCMSFHDIPEEIISGIDYVVNLRQEEIMDTPPSVVIRLGSKGEIKILRK